ncbi:MAG: EF-hand protein [Brevundimonas sp.]|nr:EF-hand protein [Brevundimonas sp.]
MMKSLAALGLVAMTCACASGPERAAEGPPPPMGPQVFVSPFGEPYRSQPGEPYPVAAWFATADTDSDGKVTPAEFSADGQRFFTALDANNDGLIGQGEIVAYEAMAARLFEGHGGARGPGGGRPGGGARGGMGGSLGLADGAQQDGGMGRPGAGMGDSQDPAARSGPRGGVVETSMLAMAGLLNVPEPVKAADVDVNQRVTPQEWSQAGDRWFRLLDANKDGVLTLAELPQTGLQRRGGPRR